MSKFSLKKHQFLVSSSIMSQTSPEFEKLFTQHASPRERIKLPDEDPVAFHLICQSAHGSFIPNAHISLETLVKMANALQRYKIPATSRVHHTVAFGFLVRTIRPETLSMVQLLMLLHIARILGSEKYEQFLQEVSLHCPLRLEALSDEPIADIPDTNCIVVLANLMLRVAACRAEVACTLLSAAGSDGAFHAHQKSDLAVWVLEDSPSLKEIDARIQDLKRAVDLQRDQLHDASGTIKEATADINRYVRATIGDGPGPEESRTEETMNLDTCHDVKRLEILIAEDEHASKNFVNIDNLDLDDTSSHGTAFEDIEAHSKPTGITLDDYLDHEDAESVVSARTI
ncbi:uncharacterized protein SETTUDRAFT_109185 [Exserohilum turcica Et28A]|uniref:BTB domain-containing protein n=1 Tax=Exserohilum turcicum (strain 28A) TaxID=671987 RepID=R0K418_EXST2|nr:uncharacterized protein SETTUDRAFT_109185 [Exserohilum turcica Et28A]EOA87838.1 hypothetical protein SETTUDRAFT_109185 [Exserohilum turcica Et28A]